VPTPDSSHERIIATATTLFAEHGYDGTSARLVATAVDLNVATVAYHVGSKADLYQEVMRRAHLAEAEALEKALARFRADAAAEPVQAVGGLVEAYLDFCLTHPHIPALWMRRWLSDAAEVAGLEAEYSRPLVDSVRAAVAEALPDIAARGDIEMTIWTVMWAISGFCRSGILDSEGVRRGPDDEQSVERFRIHLRGLVLREFGLDGGERPGNAR
jgi:AcrR family transcriptional regulator